MNPFPWHRAALVELMARRDRLPHALLVHGPAGIGKTQFARAFAAAALRLRYDDPHTAPVGPEKLLELRRYEDAGDNLWNVLNRLQENLCRGGLQDESRRRVNGKRFPRTRAITGLDRNVKLNKELWSLAQRVANGEPLSFAE